MRKLKINLSTLGHILIFLAVGGLMVVNALLLYRMQNKVDDEKSIAEEVAKPAEITLTVLTTPTCLECFDINNLIAPLKENDKVKISKEESFDYTSQEGAELVQKYAITRVPTLIIKGDTAKLFDQASFLQNLGRSEADGTLIVTNIPPPYVEVASGSIKGRFTAIYLGDKGCKDCYDPALHRQALAGLAMQPSEEKFMDRTDAEGRRLVRQYKIESAPTLLLTGDLAEYPRFQQVWSSVGTVEKDGMYVFRAGQSLMGAYHDLKTNKVIKPPSPEQAASTQPSASQPSAGDMSSHHQ